MGQMQAEQAVAIIDAVRETVEVTQPEPETFWQKVAIGVAITLTVGWIVAVVKKVKQ